MAGRGPAPKDPRRRARTNEGPVPFRIVPVIPTGQPSLVDVMGETNPLTGSPWTHPTLLLWSQLKDFPTTAALLPAQWSSLARAFMLDDALVNGHAQMATEARLRISKYGIDPDDLTRLRVQIVAADEAEAKPPVVPKSRARRGGLKALPAVGE